MIITGLVVGIALGAVMQRGRFCVTGMLRDIFLSKSFRGIVALLLVIAVHAIGLAALTSLGIISPEYSTFAPMAVIAGGFLFGISIILAGGCASGTWYRTAEGLIGSLIALLFYGLSAAAMKTGPLTGFNEFMHSWDTGATTLNDTLGISVWWLVIPFAIAVFAAARYFLAKDAGKPKAMLNQPWYKRSLHQYGAAVLIGIIGVIAWPLSAETGRNYGLGITTPTSHVMSYTVTGESAYMNWGTLLVLGLLVGAFLSAKAAGEFRIRVPDSTTAVRSVVGGIGMGVGASLAGGCTVGNGMVETSLFSYQGWIALACIAAGVGVGAKIWLKPKAATQSPEPVRSAEDDVLDSTPALNVQPIAGVITAPVREVAKAKRLAEGRYFLDQMGAICPFPLVEAKDVMAELHDGDELVIDFDCTQATDSIPQWAADDGHAVIDFTQNQDAGWQITLVKHGA